MPNKINILAKLKRNIKKMGCDWRCFTCYLREVTFVSQACSGIAGLLNSTLSIFFSPTIPSSWVNWANNYIRITLQVVFILIRFYQQKYTMHSILKMSLLFAIVPMSILEIWKSGFTVWNSRMQTQMTRLGLQAFISTYIKLADWLGSDHCPTFIHHK